MKLTEIFEESLIPFIRKVYPEKHQLMQDTDLKHVSKVATQYLEDNGIVWWKTPGHYPMTLVYTRSGLVYNTLVPLELHLLCTVHCTCMYICTCMYVHVYMYMYVCTCMYVHVHVNILNTNREDLLMTILNW